MKKTPLSKLASICKQMEWDWAVHLPEGALSRINLYPMSGHHGIVYCHCYALRGRILDTAPLLFPTKIKSRPLHELLEPGPTEANIYPIALIEEIEGLSSYHEHRWGLLLDVNETYLSQTNCSHFLCTIYSVRL